MGLILFTKETYHTENLRKSRVFFQIPHAVSPCGYLSTIGTSQCIFAVRLSSTGYAQSFIDNFESQLVYFLNMSFDTINLLTNLHQFF